MKQFRANTSGGVNELFPSITRGVTKLGSSMKQSSTSRSPRRFNPPEPMEFEKSTVVKQEQETPDSPMFI